jgi:hypothetical protein
MIISATYGSVFKDRLFWLGATDICNEGSWRWCYGNNRTSLLDRDKTPFQADQPDNWLKNEHCAMTSELVESRLNDVGCNININFICEV